MTFRVQATYGHSERKKKNILTNVSAEERSLNGAALLYILIYYRVSHRKGIAMADCGFENKQKWKKVYKNSALLAILSKGPQKKFV
jgi:hypothetical protein